MLSDYLGKDQCSFLAGIFFDVLMNRLVVSDEDFGHSTKQKIQRLLSLTYALCATIGAAKLKSSALQCFGLGIFSAFTKRLASDWFETTDFEKIDCGW